MKIKWMVYFILSLVVTACSVQATGTTGEAFELYLLEDSQAHGSDIINTPLNDITLAETPLLTTADLVSYEHSTHTLQLTDGGFQKVTDLLEEGFQVAGIPFVIVSRGERIYAGAFWTMLSSQSFDGVVIMDPVFLTESNTIQITLGYPGSGFFTGTDPRADARLMDALEGAGVLK
ncbi:hypothetical protein JR338_11260 [Chloroflexota bacterium]|nr:hypothetical protein JR338_11260 [Chloroflexota bacterium]